MRHIYDQFIFFIEKCNRSWLEIIDVKRQYYMIWMNIDIKFLIIFNFLNSIERFDSCIPIFKAILPIYVLNRFDDSSTHRYRIANK